MKTEYRYEFGKRWNVKLPRNDIAFLVKRMHCVTADDKVVANILDRAQRSGVPSYMWNACKQYALCVHHRQKKLYYDVLRGNI